MIYINKIISKILVFIACFVFLATIVVSIYPKIWHPPEDIYPQGAGSGLDADTVDGLEASDILAAIPESEGGSCYINWDGINCYEEYTAIVKGKISVASDPNYGSGGIMCASIPDKSSTQGWGVVVDQSNLDCAICCK